jgi:hypothetical protein
VGTPTRTRRVAAQTKAIWTLLLATVICLFVPASALAAASYVFEPTLSALAPPTGHFQNPNVTTDAYGDIYVVSMAPEKEARIDVFGPSGSFITGFQDSAGPQSIAVDSEGNVYLLESIAGGETQIRRFPPTAYKPLEEEIEYSEPPVVVANDSTKNLIPFSFFKTLTVDSKDRLYINYARNIALFGTAKEGNPLLEEAILEVAEGESNALFGSRATAIDSVHKKIYVSDEVSEHSVIRVFELDSVGEPRAELKEDEIDGSTTPAGQFISFQGFLSVDVDDPLGHVFIMDPKASKVYEFEEDGTYLATIEHEFKSIPRAEIAVDDGPFSPHPQAEAFLFVPSNPAPSIGQVYAFEPKEECAAEVEATSVTSITEIEAVLHAQINPCGLPTEYRLEYISQQQYEEEGQSFASATVAGEGTLPKGGEGVEISAPAAGLEPGAAYRFRAFAENTEGKDEGEGTFATFEKALSPQPCPNDSLRTGLSILLPDCRVYELVTPPSTNGRAPSGGFGGVFFPTLEASPDGRRLSFAIEGGSLPGEEGTGVADLQLATREGEGWNIQLAGPTGKEASTLVSGSTSPDQDYSLWGDVSGIHIHYPDGHSELVGRGSLGEDPDVNAKLITEAASHILFVTLPPGAVQLEPNAPPAGTGAVYDRSAEGPTYMVSLLPGDKTPKEGENATYLGASEEGKGVAFEIKGTIYLRLHNEETFEVAGPGSIFAGVADEGKRVFYLEGGDLFAFDAAEEETIAFSESGDVTPVNVATGGTRAYFVSPSVLTGKSNPNDEEAVGGEENLYLSEEGQISFVGIVTKRDVEGELTTNGQIGGLGLWIEGLSKDAPSKDPSRATPSGNTFLFESRADLTGFESGGFAQVYRYDSAQNRLSCLSCSPIGQSPNSDASLQAPGIIGGEQVEVANQSPDGKRAFFQTAEPLVVGDTDGELDVYEWEEEGIGSCEVPGGCTYLISAPHSASPDYLYAMSSSGNDVFFGTTDLLLPRDAEATISFYDARVEGGFPEGSICHEECCGQECRPLSATPGLVEPTTSTVGPPGNFEPRGKHCPKGKRLVERHNKKVCVKKHKKRHPHRTGTRKRGGAR